MGRWTDIEEHEELVELRAENERLREQVKILEAEIRAMRVAVRIEFVPAKINAAVDAVIAADGQPDRNGL